MWGMRSLLMKWICFNYLSRKASGGRNQCIHLLERKMKPPHSQTQWTSLALSFECDGNVWLL